ncbi:putative hydrolase M10 [Pseudocercospora fuligena]|uniref:Putative hydrolase M10 n=1 Tax=Pseudocercospora fuligena TaxID=685502 RepID=A0A8H6VI45_9PEZI|nr:putative hydrolase M10 [Pseudocercospora fuligena]
MGSMTTLSRLAALSLVALTNSRCFEPSPAFPVPIWNTPPDVQWLEADFGRIEAKISELFTHEKYNTSSFSIEVTSSERTLWSSFHTAKVQNDSRPGEQNVSGLSQYRIASISKVFTTLSILYLHQAGEIDLDDPVTKYIPELNSAGYDLPFKDISIRILASQLSGLPREIAQSDMINPALFVSDPVAIGLPPASLQGLPTCDEYVQYERACNRTDFYKRLKQLGPLFAPNQKATYSNVNYELLGLVIENVTGLKYEEYIKKQIFDPLGMTSSTLNKPSDQHAVLPVLKRGLNYWDVEEGIQSPTGGIYSSSSDMSKFVRYILTHYNTVATGINWLLPASWATGINTFYGMPFEIFRIDKILEESQRPVTFVTKSGGLPGYYSQMMILEEYGIGITFLVAGEVSLLNELVNIITVELVRAMEVAIWESVRQNYSGSYVSTEASLNSSLSLDVSSSKGLHLTGFISNGTDVFNSVLPSWGIETLDEERSWYAQLVPTLLYKNETEQNGEIWRVLIVPERLPEDEENVWSSFCPTDVDTLLYAGKAINEVVFWSGRGEKILELPAWNVSLGASKTRSMLLVQP